MTSYEALSPPELAALWLSEDPSVVGYCFDVAHVKGMAYYTEWLAALINIAESESQIGNVGAGPIEACLERNIALAREVESRVSRPKLRVVLQRMWFDDATAEVKEWALQLLDEEQPSPHRQLPRGLAN